MLEIAIYWLPIVGGLIFALAVSIWYGNGNRTHAIWIGFGGVVLLAAGLALHLQKLAWQDAKPPLTNEAEVARSRAYVSPVVSQLVGFNFAAGTPFNVRVSFRNGGQTPAYEFTVAGSVDIAAFPLIAELTIDPAKKYSPNITVNPGNQFDLNWGVKPLTPELWDAIKAGRAAIYVHGIYRYRDAFGIGRNGTFRYYFGGTDGLRSDLALTIHAVGNSTD